MPDLSHPTAPLPIQGHAHGHEDGHGHKDAHSHEHGHSHTPLRLAPARAALPASSLLRLSLGGRLAIALGAVAVIWGAVLWAMLGGAP